MVLHYNENTSQRPGNNVDVKREQSPIKLGEVELSTLLPTHQLDLGLTPKSSTGLRWIQELVLVGCLNSPESQDMAFPTLPSLPQNPRNLIPKGLRKGFKCHH